MKISKQLKRSNCSLLSADNSIPEESEEEDIIEEDIEEERKGKVGGEETMSTSSAMEGEEGGKRASGGDEVGEARTSQGSSEGWETESETSCMEVSSSDATEMEVSVEISGIVRRRETKSVRS